MVQSYRIFWTTVIIYTNECINKSRKVCTLMITIGFSEIQQIKTLLSPCRENSVFFLYHLTQTKRPLLWKT